MPKMFVEIGDWRVKTLRLKALSLGIASWNYLATFIWCLCFGDIRRVVSLNVDKTQQYKQGTYSEKGYFSS